VALENLEWICRSATYFIVVRLSLRNKE